MADVQVSAKRVARFREVMTEKGYDAVILRHNPDLRWLTDSERTFDFEDAHTAFITADALYLHTDSRYFGTFKDRLGDDTPWQIDMDTVGHAAWAAKHVATSRARVVAVEDTVELAFFDDLQRELADQSIAALMPRMHGAIADLRIVKDPAEIELMRHAQSITDKAFLHMLEYIKPGLTEQQIRAELENYMLSHGADALSFDSIVASGPNGANPHAQPGERVVQKGDMIVMDYGAGYLDYHSDMTRTVVLGQPSEEQQHVFDVVRLANETCAKAIHAGVIGADIHNLAVKVISDAGYGEYFGHGLGHGVGVEIHERPFCNARYDKVLPAGSVVTDEPGIYLPGKFGIRLEDFGVVTEDGYDVFTQSTHDLMSIDC
ncbi:MULTISPECIES: Xaa-Pro peptidase family protein [Atopobiaceae]|uniref:M24 family metallopeptidase n=1 Tax=Atopobiaceae TaxID=1643824 RepID=UPI00034E6143|nr:MULTISPECIES: aminopeptidase P family protein [Atopobiaceae]EPD78256.1 xaa-Pro aminopeptidase [Atopobium sp. oral taxon 199 str. F0494]